MEKNQVPIEITMSPKESEYYEFIFSNFANPDKVRLQHMNDS